LRSGDSILIHSNGYIYTYKVRENLVVKADDTSPLKHEVDPWLTLITCKTYNEDRNTYSNRVAVRAELVNVEKDGRLNTSDKER
jgi:LPXTG-site transpeptidase (sortase) family protein